MSLISALSAVGCTANTGGEPSESVGQSNYALSVYQCSTDSPAANSHSAAAPALATYTSNGFDTTVMVHSSADSSDHSLWWATSYYGTTDWTLDAQIPSMASSTPPRIAAFNGYLYMVHTGDNDKNVWMARFNTSTQTWSHDFLTPFASNSSPALAAFNGALHHRHDARHQPALASDDEHLRGVQREERHPRANLTE